MKQHDTVKYPKNSTDLAVCLQPPAKPLGLDTEVLKPHLCLIRLTLGFVH